MAITPVKYNKHSLTQNTEIITDFITEFNTETDT